MPARLPSDKTGLQRKGRSFIVRLFHAKRYVYLKSFTDERQAWKYLELARKCQTEGHLKGLRTPARVRSIVQQFISTCR